ncbi:MAG: hypothetical protein P4L84_30970 [Isosphaeraceae bacterium]|nr:hypothetical protein [Isosphaeraceae bacterium]
MRSSEIRMLALGFSLVLTAAAVSRGEEEQELKLSDCPAAVQRTLRAEAKGAPIEVVTKETGEDSTTYWATVVLAGKNYAVGVAGDGTLNEVSLEADEHEVKFAKCPPAVQATFRHESKDAKIDTVDKDVKYGTTVYATVAAIGGKDYALVVAQDGTLVEKTLVIEEDDIDLTNCPTAVQKALHEQARGGKVGSISRSSGIVGHVYDAEVEIEGKNYVVEVAENGMLVSKWIGDSDK